MPPINPRLWPLTPQEHYRQRRQRDAQRERSPMMLGRRRLDAAEVAQPAAPVLPGVAVQHLLPVAPAWHARPVTETRHRREVAQHQHESLLLAAAQEAEYALLRVVGVDPGEARRTPVQLVQGRLAPVETVQVLHPALDAGVRRVR